MDLSHSPQRSPENDANQLDSAGYTMTISWKKHEEQDFLVVKDMKVLKLFLQDLSLSVCH